MRIACLHIPQFALQSATRVDPALRGAAVAVVSGVEPGREAAGVLHAPIVLACSRLAWSQGVRLGMTAASARTQSPAIQIVTADVANERETVRAIADVLLGIAATVDVGGRVGAGAAHLAMYAEVPAKTRGAAFGERLVELIDELGLAARVGIADDRFTAWVAAAHTHDADARSPQGGPSAQGGLAAGHSPRSVGLGPPQGGPSAQGGLAAGHSPRSVGLGPKDGARPSARLDSLASAREVVVVPRGGSAAFLAPRPLSLLAISPEVQHMLEALGVRTLGEFAALPAPSVARPLDADYRALARGESDTTLRPYVPEAPIREEVTVSAGNVLELRDLLPAGEHAEGLSIGAAIALLARRIELRLAGRGRGAARLDITALGRGDARELPVTLDVGIANTEPGPKLGSRLGTRVDPLASGHDAVALAHVIATAVEAVAAEHAAAHDEWRLRVVVAGERVLGGEITEIFAEGTAPYAQVEAASIYASSSDAAAGKSAGTLAFEPAGASTSVPRRAQHVREHDARRRSADHPAAERIDDPPQRIRVAAQPAESGAYDPLALVLSSSGSLFALSPPTLRVERRDAHRRTRRGKQRRTRPTPGVQPRLFDRTSSKS